MIAPVYAEEVVWEGRTITRIETEPQAFLTHPAMTLRVGDPYRAEAIRTMLTALHATGLLEDARVDATLSAQGEVALHLRLTEKRIIASIAVTGNHFVSDTKILQAAGFQPGEAFTESRWEMAAANLMALYRKEGYYQARPTPRFLSDPKGGRLILEMREGNRARIHDLRFTGALHVSPRSLKLRMRSRPGEYFHAETLQDDLQRLRSFYIQRGHLKAEIGEPTIEFLTRTGEVTLTLPVSASDRIDLVFENPAPFSSKTLREKVRIQEERRDDNEALEESARRIAQSYQEIGYARAEVAVSSKWIAQGHREVRFVIQRGPQTHVTEILIVGNDARLALPSAIPMKVGDPYRADQLGRNVIALTQFYQQAGFGEAHVTGEVGFSENREAAQITFRIEEGSQTRIGVVKIVSDAPVPDATIHDVMRPGTPYHPSSPKEGEHLLAMAYAREGYLHVTIGTEIQSSQDRALADVTYTVHAGPQIRLGTTRLEGNLRTQDAVLLREISLKSGARYQPQEILTAQRRLYRTGLFSSVRLEPVATADPTVQDLHLQVVERPSVTLAFGAGYAEHERVRGFLEGTNRNLWGTGNEISVRAEANHLEETYSLNFRQPWFFSQNLEGRASLARINEKEVSFDLETLRATAGIDKHFSETLKGTVRYEYEQHSTREVSPDVLQALEDTGKLNIATINLSLIRDTRDDPFQPRSGRVYSATLRNAAKVFGSEVQLVKLSLQGSGYRALGNRFVLAASVRVGLADRFGETALIPLPERFFLGGRNSVRGYGTDQLGIQDGPPSEQTRIDGQPTGGNASLVLNEEIRIALPRSLGLVFFLDHGNVWQRYTDVALSQIKSTVGAGVRYNTPVGPLRLDWGYKLDREVDEDAAALHFTLGHAF
jgi:outer membrane protein insertion porin family